MTFRYADYTKQVTGAGIGTGAFVFTSTPTGFAAFSAMPSVANGDLVPYSAWDGAGNREVGIATYNTGGSLTRTTILRSTNSNAAVSFTNPVTVWCDAPSAKLPLLDQNGNLGIGAASSVNDQLSTRRDNNGPNNWVARNFSAGAATTANIFVDNGTYSGALTMHGTSFTTSNADRQNGLLVGTNGPGGLTFFTSTDGFYWWIGSTRTVVMDVSNFDASNLAGKFAALTVNGFLLDGSSSGSGPALTSQGSVTLPGGIILKFGYVVAPGTGGATITFPVAFPNNILSCWACAQESGTQQFVCSTYPQSASQMQLSTNITGSYQIAWFALGR